MNVDWKDPSIELPVIPKGKTSVCVMVTPGDGYCAYPLKAWFNGDGYFYLASSGERANVKRWDYYPEHFGVH